jgi:hypothetical protein
MVKGGKCGLAGACRYFLCEREMGEGKCKIPRFEMKKRFGK